MTQRRYPVLEDVQAMLDPLPQRVHDSDPMPSPHEESCGCSFCTPKQTERIPLDQWWNEPAQIAHLYRWLKMRDRLPEDTADFIAHARSWERDYADLVMWAGPA